MIRGKSPSQTRSRELNPLPARGAAVLQELLAELALVLLPRGVTPKRFGEFARLAFVQAAANMSRLRNGRVNQSRVAAQTGLSRADVKRLLGADLLSSVRPDQTPIRRVINAWRTDRRFCTKSGRPKRLSITGAGASFENLVRRYAGDIPHRAVLTELRRMRAVVEQSGTVQMDPSLQFRGNIDYSFLSPVLPALVDGIRIASSKTSSGVIQRLDLAVRSDIDLAMVRERCRSSTRAMLEGLGHSLGAHITRPRNRRTSLYSFAVTVLLAENCASRQ